jgi:Protein of unknown function (DUF1496)
MAEVCYYADEEYSEGSIIKVEGDLYECGDLGEGILTWIEYFGGKEVQAGPVAAPYQSQRRWSATTVARSTRRERR